METIKNYLEGMFAGLPGSSEVLRAKNELYQMMEDKYNELIAEGKSDNEAVGIVISEFGNLNELAEDLGISEVKAEMKEIDYHMVGKEEAMDYLGAKRKHSLYLGLGVFLCIICVIGPIMSSFLPTLSGVIGVTAMFGSIAAGVVLIVFSNVLMHPYEHFMEVPSRLDYAADTMIREERERYVTTHALRLTAGILLCVLCWLPCVLADEIFSSVEVIADGMAPTCLFLAVGIGVFLIVQTNSENAAFNVLLSLNSDQPSDQPLKKKRDGRDVPDYKNPTIDVIMHVFWPTMTCIYLVWSFLTFSWWITWIIWPIAGVVFGALKTVFRDEEK